MPAEVITAPLGVAFVFSDATRFMVRLDRYPCGRLVTDMASGLAALAHPHGSLNTAHTVTHYRVAVGHLARFMDAHDFRGGAAQLTRARLVEYWLGTGHANESATRRMLQAWDT